MDLTKIFTYPYDNELILRKQKSLRRELAVRENVGYIEKKVAILGGSTVDDIKNILEIFLLHRELSRHFINRSTINITKTRFSEMLNLTLSIPML